MTNNGCFLHNTIVDGAISKSTSMIDFVKTNRINDSFDKEELNETIKFLNDSGIIKSEIHEINDSDVSTTMSSFTGTGGIGVITLPNLYLTNLYRDNGLLAIPPINVLNLGHRYIEWFGAELNGLPDRYHDHNEVPKISIDVAIQRRPIISLQIAVETTLLEKYYNQEINLRLPNFNVDRLKSLAAQQALMNGLNSLFFQGAPSLGVYGLFNDPSLLSAISLTSSNWDSVTNPTTATYSEIISQLNKVFNALSVQSEKDLSELNATLILPSKFQAILTVINPGGTQTVGDYLKARFPNVKVIFSAEANSQGSDNLPVGLLFNNSVSFEGVPSSPFIRPVGLTYSATPISTNQQTLKVTQELYVAQSAGAILTSPLDVVALKWTS